MRCASVGFHGSVAGVETLDYSAPQELDRYDAIFWHTDAPFDAFAGDIERPGALPVLSSRGSQRLLACARIWRAELRAALNMGKAVCLLVGPERQLAYHTFEDIMVVDRMDPLADMCRIATEPASGVARMVSGEPFARALTSALELGQVHTSLSGGFGTPLAKAGDGVIASYSYSALGHLLLLPAATARTPLPSQGLLALIELMETLMQGGDWIGFEPWARDYRLPLEASIAEDIDAARAELKRAADAVSELEERASTLRRRRALVGATGRSLTRGLEKAYGELGVLTLGHTCGPDVLVLEEQEGFRLALIVDDPDCEPKAVLERFREVNAQFEAEFMATAQATLIDARANRLGPAASVVPPPLHPPIEGGEVLTPKDILDRLPAVALWSS